MKSEAEILIRETLAFIAHQRLLGSLKEKSYIEPAGEGGGWRVLITPSI